MIVTKMTPAQYAEAGDKLTREEGLTLTGNAGELHKAGVTADYKFDGQELTIKVTKHPMFLTAGFCENQIAEALRQQGLTCEVRG